MKKHVIWSIWCSDVVSCNDFCLLEFDEDSSPAEVCDSCLKFENLGVHEPHIRCEVYYTED